MDYIEYFKNDRFAAGTGVELIEVKPGYAKAILRVEDKHLNVGNVVQGGALFTLADLAMAAAANAHGNLAFTIQSDIRFLQSAKEGEVLTAEANEVLFHRTLCHYRVEVRNEANHSIAIFDGICYRKGELSFPR